MEKKQQMFEEAEMGKKILEIFEDYQVTHGGLILVAGEIAALIEPYQKLIKAQDEYIKFLKDKPASGTIAHRIHREKIEQLKQQLK